MLDRLDHVGSVFVMLDRLDQDDHGMVGEHPWSKWDQPLMFHCVFRLFPRGFSSGW